MNSGYALMCSERISVGVCRQGVLHAADALVHMSEPDYVLTANTGYAPM